MFEFYMENKSPEEVKEYLRQRQEAEAEKFAKRIDEQIFLWFKRPKYCPMFLYRYIGKIFLVIEQTNEKRGIKNNDDKKGEILL